MIVDIRKRTDFLEFLVFLAFSGSFVLQKSSNLIQCYTGLMLFFLMVQQARSHYINLKREIILSIYQTPLGCSA